uniref:Uncharacterized protein n=1 Tax=Mycena chlorophos TaxID=658473 RepID=A0ABQ0KYB8_MYCCL|nr:predicted protein [Mycena chlorophos]GAT43908.1 predicted protein [Mycena chlorophos]
MGAILGPLWADYYVLRRGNVHVPSLFDPRPGSTYWFFGGFNWRAIFAWCVGTALTIPGIAAGYNPGAVNQAAVNLYSLGWLLSVFSSGAIYLALSYAFPVPIAPEERREMKPLPFEYLADKEGFFDEDLPWDVRAISGGRVSESQAPSVNDETSSDTEKEDMK